jgi:CHAT domain-containing protein
LAALHDGKHFLINQYAIATTPGLTLTDPKPLKRTNMSLLLNGLTQSVQGFPALPNVNTELEAISKLYNSTILKDGTFLIDSVEKELSATSFRAIHIASHGQFKSNPKDSFLLTYDNKLNMDRLKQMMGISKYRDEPVELLTLSACQTAAGDDRAALGLAGIAVKAGARSALATLWFINDQASSQLITDFYTQLKDSSLSKAKALQRAQVKMISDKRYKHPSYWAPFLLIGNWL